MILKWALKAGTALSIFTKSNRWKSLKKKIKTAVKSLKKEEVKKVDPEIYINPYERLIMNP